MITVDQSPGPASVAESRTEIECVVIGRNEATRLRDCLVSVLGCDRVVYVDSGSTDGSVTIARSLGVDVVELDPARAFSAARARNEGFAYMRQLRDADRVLTQFVDGDCCLDHGWLAAGEWALRRDPTLAVVTGRCREESARSLYDHLCDIELDVPPGEIDACGGVAMMRASALQTTGGFDGALVAGEEPELCLRLRRLGWRIECLPVPMMRHDAAISSWRQWWRRSARGGRAYAASWMKHRGSPERFRAREVARIAVWGGIVPVLTAFGVLAFGVVGLACVAANAWPCARAYRWARCRGRQRPESLLYGIACVVGKVPEFTGVVACCLQARASRPRHR